MARPEDRAALKQNVRAKLLELEGHELAVAVEHHERFLNEAVLGDREAHDNSEIAESRENADLAAAFDGPVHTHHAKIDAIEGLDFGLTDMVGPGAIVSFNGRWFVIAVSTLKFDCDGTEFMGISTQSPVYAVIDGLQEGDEFTYNGRNVTLDAVF